MVIMDNQNTQLDQDAVNLAKAIRQQESGGDFQARGKSGEYGAYQFTEPTWKVYAKKHLGQDVPLSQATPEQQNEVAYKQIKEWKDAGRNPGEIASMWNAGESRKNAYLEGNSGVNKYGVHYDTAAYAKAVAENYQKIKSGSLNTPQPVEEPKKDFLQKATDVITSIFPGKQVGETLGTAFVAGKEALKGNTDIAEQIASTAPKPSQVLGDVAQGALMVGAGGPKSIEVFGKEVPAIKTAFSPLGKLAQGVKLGTATGITQGMKEGDTATETLKKGFQGATTGGILSGVGIGIDKLSQVLPKWLIPFKMSPETAQYTLTKKLGAPSKMLARSDNEISSLGKKLENTLAQEKYKGVTVSGKDIYQRISQELPDAQLSPDELVSEITKVAKLKKGLVNKLFTPEGLSLPELQRLNSEIGNNTYKTVFDTPETKAGKKIGNAVYHAIGDAIRAIANEDKVDSIYSNLSKEYLLNNSIKKFVSKSGGRTAISLNDLVSFDVGGLPLAATRRVIGSPTAQLKTANLIKNIGGKTSKTLQKASRVPLMKQLIGNE